MRIPAGQGIAGWVLASGQPIELSDVTHDPRFARDVAERTGYVPRSILAMPVEGSQQTLGVLEVLDRGRADGLGADQSQLLSPVRAAGGAGGGAVAGVRRPGPGTVAGRRACRRGRQPARRADPGGAGGAAGTI
jgi:hypothetical protein